MKTFLTMVFALAASVLSSWATEQSYTISFNPSNPNAEGGKTDYQNVESILNDISLGKGYVESVVFDFSTDKIYPFTSKLKMGNTTTRSILTLNLSESGKVNATRISVKAAKGTPNDANLFIQVGGITYHITNGQLENAMKDFVFDLKSIDNAKIDNIKLYANKELYFQSITVYYDEDVNINQYEYAVDKQLTFSAQTNSQAISDYNSTWSATVDGFTWNIVNFSNFNNQNAKIGCPLNVTSGTVTSSITTVSPIETPITHISLDLADVYTKPNVNYVNLYTSETANFSNPVEIIPIAMLDGQQVIALSEPRSNLYYKIEAEIASRASTLNQYPNVFTLSNISYYYQTANEAELKDPELAFTPNTVVCAAGYKYNDLVSFTNTFTGEISFTSSNPDVAVFENGVLIAKKLGSTTITATSEATEAYNAGEATLTVTVGVGNISKFQRVNTVDRIGTSAYYTLVYVGSDNNAVAMGQMKTKEGDAVTQWREGVALKHLVNADKTVYIEKNEKVTRFRIVQGKAKGKVALLLDNGNYLGCSNFSGRNKLTETSTLDNSCNLEMTFDSEGHIVLKFSDNSGYSFMRYANDNTIGVIISNLGETTANSSHCYLYQDTGLPTTSSGLIFNDELKVEDLEKNQIAKDENGQWIADHIVMNELDEYDICVDIAAQKVDYLREVNSSATWSAINLPYAVPSSSLIDYEVIELQELQNDQVVFAHVNGDMEANHPYLIRKKDTAIDPSSDIAISVEEQTVVMAKDESIQKVQQAELIGVYEPTVIPAGCYGLAGGTFRKAAEGNTNELAPFRAYLKIDDETIAQSRSMRIGFGKTTTGIEDLEVEIDAEFEENVFYDLKGRRIDNPENGVYIFNGIKVLVK